MFDNLPLSDPLMRGIILAIFALGWMNLLIRVNGLRTLSKMTNFDFVTTVAYGSLLAGAAQAGEMAGYAQALAGMAGLVLAQAAASWLRQRSESFTNIIGNEPVLIMREGAFIDAALKANNIRREDMIAKLREANVLQFSSVRAAILETTGDVSVLHGQGPVEEAILGDVRKPYEPAASGS